MAGTGREEANAGFGSLRHLAVRFVGALDPRGPRPGDEAWAEAQLLPGEVDLWRSMSGPDRRHAVGVARSTLALLESPASDADASVGRPVIAAALLHDVGKVSSGLGTFARVAVTVAAMVLGRSRVIEGAGRAGGWRRRAADYLAHDAIGARLLSEAGSDPLTEAWAREHHLPEDRWTVGRRVGDALKRADGD